ncbi:WD40 repeat domain-containing protein [Streptomyces sp. NPDC051940]|uniref:WD40 repeat domain-containing protein n=1 Tax=Streptomyces sp. NPDC051940 TaxID=3155675 RepID=UPI00343D1A5E
MRERVARALAALAREGVDVADLLDAMVLAATRAGTDAVPPPPGEGAGADAAAGHHGPGAGESGGRESARAGTRPQEAGTDPDEPAMPVWLEQPGSSHAVPGGRLSAGRAAALPDALGIGRALRPLRRRRPSPTRSHLDVDATVEHYTRTGLLVPQLRPAAEPWLEAVVVLDRGTAMAVWDEAVRTLTKTLRELGAFRDVRVWHLEHPPHGTPRLRDDRGRVLGADAHRQPAHRLLLVVSDCAAPAWREDALWRLLHAWGRTAPLALINPLPTRLWRLSGLDLPRTTAVSPAPGAAGRRLVWRRPRLLREAPGVRPWQALPVLPLAADPVLAWARALMRMDPDGCDVVLVPATGRLPRRAAVRDDASRPSTADEVRARAEAFTAEAEPAAVQLAVAASPLDTFTLPVLDILRERVVQEGGLADTAEFLTAGLLTTVGKVKGDLLYRFRPAAAEHLQGLLSRDQLWRTHLALSEHLAERLQSPHGIALVLQRPEALETVPVGLRPVAAAAAVTARVLGLRVPEGPGAGAGLPELPQLAPGPQPEAGVPEPDEVAEGFEEHVLHGHSGTVRSAAFSPDGSLVATGSYDSTVRIWDAVTGQLLQDLTGHLHPVNGVAFSPDGTCVASGADDDTVRICEVGSGSVRLVITGHAGWVNMVAFSPDGTRLATAGEDGTARIWDTATGQQLRVLVDGRPEQPVKGVAFSPDGAFVATASFDRTARVWETSTGALVQSFSVGNNSFNAVAFSPDGSLLAAAEADTSARVWDIATGRQVHVLAGHGDWVRSVAFSPDGTLLATAGDDGTARVWDIRTGLAVRILAGHSDWVWHVAFSPDGTRLVTAGGDQTARLWDLASTAPPRSVAPFDPVPATWTEERVLTGHTNDVNAVAFSPDGTRVASASDDTFVRVWDARTGELLNTLTGHSSLVLGVAFSPDGTRLASAGTDNARIWDARSGRTLATLGGLEGWVRSVAFSPDGSRLVTAGDDRATHIWDARTGAAVTELTGHEGRVRAAEFSPDGTLLATADDAGTARLWDTRTWRSVTSMAEPDVMLLSVAFSPDGTRVATTGTGPDIRVWDAVSGEPLVTINDTRALTLNVAFSPDGLLLATTSAEGDVQIWYATTGDHVTTLTGHTEWVRGVAFSPDGTRLATSGDDQTVRIWTRPSDPAPS